MSELISPRRGASVVSLLSLTALSACSFSMLPDHPPKRDTAGSVEYEVSSGFVSTVEGQDEYPFVREGPTKTVDADGESTNDCAQLDSTFAYGALSVWIKSGDPNGPYVGYHLQDMPADIRKDCAADIDGIVWITEKAIVQHITGTTDSPSHSN